MGVPQRLRPSLAPHHADADVCLLGHLLVPALAYLEALVVRDVLVTLSLDAHSPARDALLCCLLLPLLLLLRNTLANGHVEIQLVPLTT